MTASVTGDDVIEMSVFKRILGIMVRWVVEVSVETVVSRSIWVVHFHVGGGKCETVSFIQLQANRFPLSVLQTMVRTLCGCAQVVIIVPLCGAREGCRGIHRPPSSLHSQRMQKPGHGPVIPQRLQWAAARLAGVRRCRVANESP